MLWLSAWMVHHANVARDDGDGTKVGGHQASSASVASLMTALYFKALGPGDAVALKAHAAVAPDRHSDKAAADVYDAWRLVRAWGPSVIAEDLSRAPVPMLSRTAAQLRHLYVDDVDRTAHRLRRASVPGVAAVDAEELSTVSVLLDALDPFLVWDPPAPPPASAPREPRATP